jgi:molybdopterin adenylyltransferase
MTTTDVASGVSSTPVKIGLVTVSDRASTGVYEDRGGPAMEACLVEFLQTPFVAVKRLVADEEALISDTIVSLVDDEGCCLVVTTGGTGPSRRDVTVEATKRACHKMMPGFGELMRQVSLAAVPTAILSRQEAGIRYAPRGGGALVVNLPGAPKAIRECLVAVFPAIPYCIDLIEGPFLETHDDVVKAFRPKK